MTQLEILNCRRWHARVKARARWRRLEQDTPLLVLTRTVADMRRVSMTDLLEDHGPHAVFARQIAMYLGHVELGRTQRHVGMFFGRDASTVSHACRRLETLRDDKDFDAELTSLEEQLRRGRRRHAH